MPQKQRLDTEKQNILILGGGFAGIRTALDLGNYLGENSGYEIILIDKHDYHLFTSALYEAATAEHGYVEAKKVKRAVTIPHAQIFRHTPVKVFKAYIDTVNLEDGMVVTDSRILNFSYLVVAMGSVADFYGIPNIEKYGFTLKSLEDAIMIRNRVEDIVSKKDQGRIVIGGGGFAGAEFAGELYNLLKHECEHHGKDIKNFEIMVVEGGTSMISSLPENVCQMIYNRLDGMGIVMKFSSLITDATSTSVVINNKETYNCDLLVWTAGVKSCRMPGNIAIERDKKDRLPTTNFLNLKKYPHVFVAGDNLCFNDPVTKKPLPQTAQEAIRHGKWVAKNVYRSIHNKPLINYHPGSSKYIIPLAGKHAIFYSKSIVISGFIGWLIRRAADLRYFLSILPLGKALSHWLFENSVVVKND